MEKTRNGHYYYREPIAIVGIVALVMAIAVLVAATAQVHTLRSRMGVTFIAPSKQFGDEVATVVIENGPWLLNGQKVADNDLIFKLNAISSKNTAILVQAGSSVSADQLSRGLKVLSSAGFTNVALINPEINP